MTEFRTEIDIAASPEVVFDYLVTEQGMLQWMGQHAALEPEPGGMFAVDIAGHPIRGRYLDVDRPRRVVVSWGLAGSTEFPPGASRVSFTLTAIGAGTHVELVHDGLPDERMPGHADGWGHFLARLASAARGIPPRPDEWVPLPDRTADRADLAHRADRATERSGRA